MSNQQALSISYQNQNNWKEIQSFLPLRYQLTDAAMPKEESWEWQDNLIHLDTYRNPSAITSKPSSASGFPIIVVICLPLVPTP